MSESSHAYLLAIKVMNACSDAISQIAEERANLMDQLVEDVRERSWPWPKRSVHRANLEVIKHGGIDIVVALRADDETELDNLMSMSAAAHYDDPEMRIYVSMGDFKLIEPFYSIGA